MCQEKKGPWRSKRKRTISAWNVKSLWKTYNMTTDEFVSALVLLVVTSYKCQWSELAVLTVNGQDLSHNPIHTLICLQNKIDLHQVQAREQDTFTNESVSRKDFELKYSQVSVDSWKV